MQNNPYNSMTKPDLYDEDGTKIYFPSGKHYTLGEFLAQVNTETRLSDDNNGINTVG